MTARHNNSVENCYNKFNTLALEESVPQPTISCQSIKKKAVKLK